MKNFVFLFSLFLIFQMQSNGANVIIKGKAPGAAEKKIRWYCYEDLITFTEKKLKECIIDENNDFLLEANINKTQIAILKIGFFKSTLIVEPGKTYIVNFKPYDYDTLYNKGNPLIFKEELEYQIANINTDDINYKLRKFNILFDEFTYQYLNNPKVRIKKSYLDTLQYMIDTAKFENISDFFKIIITYRKAQLEDYLKIKRKTEIIKQYFLQQPIAFDNFEYMHFFNQYFNKYLIYNKNFIFDSLITLINNGNFQQINLYLNNDSLLQNQDFRYLIIARNINDIATHKKINKKKLIEWLSDIVNNTTQPNLQIILNNIIKQNTDLQKGKPAPKFTLKDNNNKEINLEKYKGKWIYLNFWASWCKPCIAEFKILQELLPNYSKKLEIISISIDNNYLNMFYYLKNNKFDWTFAHFNNEFDLIENYKIKNLPLYIMIDPQGNIHEYAAPSPSNNLGAYFSELIDKKKK